MPIFEDHEAMTNETANSEGQELFHVLQHIETELGPESSWPEPIRLGSLAQCVMNSILSTGNRSESVGRVLARYREKRQLAGADPALDGPTELLEEIEACGGPEGFADALENHWRAWSRNDAPLKAHSIQQAAELLQEHSINDPAELASSLKSEPLGATLKRGWLAIPGQRSGLTWRYFLMNAGMPGIKADRMITRWVTHATGRQVKPREAERLLTDAASRLAVDERRLDHAVWAYERRRA